MDNFLLIASEIKRLRGFVIMSYENDLKIPIL